MTYEEAAQELQRMIDEQGTQFPDEDFLILLDDERTALGMAIAALREKHDWVEGEKAALDAERGRR